MNSTEIDFVPYQIAIDMKSIGFDKPCLKVGNPNRVIIWKWIEVDGNPPTVNVGDIIDEKYNENWIQIPTFSQAFRWFREKYKIECYVNSYWSENDSSKRTYYANYNYGSDIFYTINIEFKTYEEAELECLKKLIEIVKEK